MASEELCKTCKNDLCDCKNCRGLTANCEEKYPGASEGCGFIRDVDGKLCYMKE
jgi:hypothetical protein